MNHEKLRERIQAGIDHHCAPLTADPYRVQKVLNAAHKEGGVAVRKKMTVSLVLAIGLILISITALAVALFSGKDMVEQYMAPMAEETGHALWTDDELSMILEIAAEHDMALSEDLIAKLQGTSPVYKEELMRLFMKLDLGEYPAAWPLAEQAWFDELLFACGLVEERSRFMPEAHEITEETALAIALEYAQSNWAMDLSDASQFQRYIQYMRCGDQDGRPIKRWDIEFEAASGDVYCLGIEPDGTVCEDPLITGIRKPEPRAKADTVTADEDIWELARKMLSDDFYTVAALASFKEQYGSLIAQVQGADDEQIQIMEALLAIPYAMPRSSDLSPDAAFDLAKDAAQANGWTDEQLGWCRSSISYRHYEGEEPVYRVCFKLKEGNRDSFYRREMPFGFAAYLSPADGALIRFVSLDELDDFERYCEFPDPHDTRTDPGVG